MTRNRRKNLNLFLFILLCSLGIGYAFLRTELQINGTATFNDARWNIYFDNLVVNPDSVELSTGNTAAVISTSKTEVTYAVTLKEPGDFYEFTVDAVNSGTMDAMIDTITSKMGGVDITSLPTYMEYFVTYSDGVELAPKQYLKAGETETYKVHIGFKKDISASDLTGQVENKTLSFGVTYIQADDTAVDVERLTQASVPVTDTIYWALQDNDNNGNYEKLIIADHEVTGSDNYQGSFAGNTVFNYYDEVPWNTINYDGGRSGDVQEIKIEGVVAPTSTAYWFAGVGYYSSVLEANLNNLNVSNVTDMNNMLGGIGYFATDFNINVSKWNTSNVTNMYELFSSAGYSATNFNINLSNWDTSKVTDMTRMFNSVGASATTWSLGDISGWDTSQVTSMEALFSLAGSSATAFELDIRGWNTSNVTNMKNMFTSAGFYSTTWNVTIPSNNSNGINNTTSEIYGYEAFVYGSPPDGRQFTLA